ncbi:tRNA (adenosine(37)-N6)-dimethylallyltransferase MiaA [soil metagenome]
MICGPTACGKSHIADLAADLISDKVSGYVPVVVVDSMQVFKELPIISNQHRRRPAELTGVVSVSEEWTLARHRQFCDVITENLTVPLVLDAGTGMYLNAILLDIPIAPRAPETTRERAAELSGGESNPRRATREMELRIMGAEDRGSIWEGQLRYETTVLYVRPDRGELDNAIALRSAYIAHEGLEEAAALLELFPEEVPITSVQGAIGVKELIDHLQGGLAFDEAEREIGTRTRRLARRQIRWFDKLTRTLNGRASVHVTDDLHKATTVVKDYVNRL